MENMSWNNAMLFQALSNYVVFTTIATESKSGLWKVQLELKSFKLSHDFS